MVNAQTLLLEKHTAQVKAIAKELGFDFVGISKADFLESEAPKLDAWLNKNYHGNMGYMAEHFDMRLDPRLLVNNAKSVVSLLYNYYPSEKLDETDDAIKISKYAYSQDYHTIIKERLGLLYQQLYQAIGEINGRYFVDSAPVMDKVWAAKSGLGWVGKNTNLINKGNGSFYFIAELIIDLPLIPDGPVKDYCGTCTRCIDACPTDAIVAPYIVDGSKCISYFTIELKEEIPAEWSGKFKNWAFGCDICQDVCPWNRFSKPHNEAGFMLSAELKELQTNGFEELTHETFNIIFKDSPLKRKKSEGFLQTLRFLKFSKNAAE